LEWQQVITADNRGRVRTTATVQVDSGPVVALVSGRDSAGRVTDLSLHYGEVHHFLEHGECEMAFEA